jgi:hypothetical protein
MPMFCAGVVFNGLPDIPFLMNIHGFLIPPNPFPHRGNMAMHLKPNVFFRNIPFMKSNNSRLLLLRQVATSE